MDNNNTIVETMLENGAVLHIEAIPLGGEQLIGTGLPHSFKEVTEVIEGLSESLIKTLIKVKPRKASVEFGLEIAIESGSMTSLLVKGSGDANLKITLEWSE